MNEPQLNEQGRPVVRIGGQEFDLSLVNSLKLRDLNEEECTTLMESCKKLKRIPGKIIVDESNLVIDGKHRLLIADELDLTEFDLDVRIGLTSSQKEELAYVANTGRRNNDTGDKKKLVVSLYRQHPNYPFRRLARMAGCSHQYAEDVIQALDDKPKPKPAPAAPAPAPPVEGQKPIPNVVQTGMPAKAETESGRATSTDPIAQRDAIARAAAIQPDASNRELGRQLECADATVARVRKSLRSLYEEGSPALIHFWEQAGITLDDALRVLLLPSGDHAGHDTVVGHLKEGKSLQEALDLLLGKPEPPVSSNGHAQPNPPPAKASPLHDDYGSELPKRCRDLYGDPWISETIDFLSDLSVQFWDRKLADGAKKRAKRYPTINTPDFIEGVRQIGNTIDQLVEHLKENRLAGLHHECEGKGCADCQMTGLLTARQYKEAKKTAKK